MATALAYPESEQGKRKGTSLKIKEVGINAGYISQARFVLRHCRDRWGMVRRNADRLIEAAKVVETLRPMGLSPQTERQARPLKPIAGNGGIFQGHELISY